MRADRLPRLERVTLCLVDLPAADEHLRQAALALAEGAAVLERLQDPDRIPEAAVGSDEVAAPALDPAVMVVDAGQRPGVAGLGEELLGAREPSRRLVEEAAQRVDASLRDDGPPEGCDVAAFLGELQRLGDEPRPAIEIESRDR